MSDPIISAGFGRKIRTSVRDFAPNSPEIDGLDTPFNDVVEEFSVEKFSFVQHAGPFTTYTRTVSHRPDGSASETTTWAVDIPVFWWLFTPLFARHFARRQHRAKHPWWAPPGVLDARQTVVLALLAAASMCTAFINTLFTQTVTYAAETFNVGEQGQGIAGAIVRLGIVLAIPFAVLGDRIGRRRVIVILSWVAPLIAAVGAFAPTFWLLTANQTIARPLGLALDVALLVVAIEEMPKNARAYGLSILALANGFGAGIAVAALPLADAGKNGWRIIYLVSLLWLFVAVRVTKRLEETERFSRHLADSRRENAQNPHRSAPKTLEGAGRSVQGPSALGLVFGGRLADDYGRRVVASTCIPVGALMISLSFVVSGPLMWICAIVGGVFAATAYPAMAVYRGELAPTGKRQTSSFLITVSALLGGSIGLVAGGTLIDHHWSYGTVMLVFASLSVVIAVLVWFRYPETAHRELEELNPQDAG